jgi:hypothetical protein
LYFENVKSKSHDENQKEKSHKQDSNNSWLVYRPVVVPLTDPEGQQAGADITDGAGGGSGVCWNGTKCWLFAPVHKNRLLRSKASLNAVKLWSEVGQSKLKNGISILYGTP